MAKSVVALVVVVVVALFFPMPFEAQQSYVNNKQLNCNESPNTTLGFVCNAAAPSCSSFLTFRSTPTYNSPATIAYLLSADASQIAAANNISDVAPLPTDTLLIVPVNCSCSGPYLQHNASYVLKSAGETYFSVANNTYQSLSTCQALIAQNPYNLRQLVPGMRLTVPLRCACPTPAQTAAGFRYLLTYLLRQGESYDSLATEFAGAGADVDGILDANMLSESALIFFFTPILIPLKIEPTKENIDIGASPPLPLPPAAIPAAPTGGGGSNSNKWIFIGVGIGAAVLVIFSSIALIWFLRHRRRRGVKSPPPKPTASESATPPLPNWSEFSEGIRAAMETLTIYRLEDLEKATNSFAESNRINGSSVYRGSFKGDEAVVKVIKGDVSREIDALRQINHSRVVRLSGFCLHQGTTYLVYEHADNGSLAECLRRSKHDSATPQLDWKQRIQIAYDVADALNYLHNFTNPPYIHKNLTTSNILLDGSMRAKVANFGLARAVDPDNSGAITRHVVGAQGYMAQEYIETGFITPKLDVFAFGVVMLELLSGREAVGVVVSSSSGEEEVVLLSKTIETVLSGNNVREKLQEFMDKSLGEDYPLEQAHTMAQLARTCVAHNVDARPAVSEVFVALSSLRSSSLDWDPSQDTSITFSE